MPSILAPLFSPMPVMSAAVAVVVPSTVMSAATPISPILPVAPAIPVIMAIVWSVVADVISRADRNAP